MQFSTLSLALAFLALGNLAHSSPTIPRGVTGFVREENGELVPIEQEPASSNTLEKRFAEVHAYTDSQTCTGNYYLWPSIGTGCIRSIDNGVQRDLYSVWKSANCHVVMYDGKDCDGPHSGELTNSGCGSWGGRVFRSFHTNCP